MSRLLGYKPVQTLTLALASTNVTTAAWVQISAATLQPCSSIEIYNGSDSILQVATGAIASEVAIPYSITPGKSVHLPVEIAKGKRVSLKAVDKTANVEYVVLNLFG